MRNPSFPNAATSWAWCAMGWNDFASGYNLIYTSGRAVPMRLAKYCRLVEDILGSPNLSNVFYGDGVEDCLCFARGKAKIIYPVQEMIESVVVDMPVPTPCDFCGKPCESMLLCDAGLLSDYCCSIECMRNRLQCILRSDVMLHSLFAMKPTRPNATIPEDEEEMLLHFMNVPACSLQSMLEGEHVDAIQVFLDERKLNAKLKLQMAE